MAVGLIIEQNFNINLGRGSSPTLTPKSRKGTKTMNLWQLLAKVNLRSQGCGNYLVTIEYKGKHYTCHSNNSLAYDRMKNYLLYRNRERVYEYTLKQALQSFYDECKRNNNLT